MVKESIIKETAGESRLNAQTVLKELQWLSEVINARLKLHFGQECVVKDISELDPPDFSEDHSVYAHMVSYYGLSFNERVLLALALAPHVAPQLLDVFFARNGELDRGFTEFGGLKSRSHNGFLPSGETALFILCGNDLGRRFSMYELFGAEHVFRLHSILWLDQPEAAEPFYSGALTMNEEYVEYLTLGSPGKPAFSLGFPAKNISTLLNWDDLVLDESTLEQLEEVNIWLRHGESLREEWHFKKIIKPGYKVLFHGPPGTGKTLAACLLGKSSGREVYRIDLSMVVSKYIGETEKNLEKVFRKAEHKSWILFFDEADALFGKRTGISDSHDKYANQEVAYLLQRLEDYNGLVILATNLKSNIDEAFSRRLQSVVHFPFPKNRERLRLWENSFSANTQLEPAVNLEQVALKYELAGGSIVNVVQYCALMARNRGEEVIRHRDLISGIKKEYQKEGKTI